MRWSIEAVGEKLRPHDVLPYALGELVASGLSTTAGLRSMTREAAHACGLGARKGRLAPGYDADLLALNSKITDCNRAVFDVEHDFAGCIPGCHEILRRQGLLEGTWCLNPDEVLSPGQAEELDRVHAGYPEMNDDAFVAENLDRWLA